MLKVQPLCSKFNPYAQSSTPVLKVQPLSSKFNPCAQSSTPMLKVQPLYSKFNPYEAGPAITFYLGKWGSPGQFCSDRPKTSDLDVSDQVLSEAIDS